MSILGKRREFLVRQGYRPGQANAYTMRRIKAQRLRDGADRVARRSTRLQRGIVHHRLNQQDMPCLAQVGRFPAGEERAPGKEGRAPRHSVLERLREGRHRRFDVLQRNLALLEALQDVGQRQPGHRAGSDRWRPATGAALRGQGHSSPTRHRPTAGTATLRARRKDLRRAIARSGKDPASPSGPPPDAGRVVGKLGSGAIDDNHGEVVELRKRRFEGELSLPPFQPLRDQLGGIGRH